MIGDNHKIELRVLRDEDIPLLNEWLGKEYIKKWFGEKEQWLNEIEQRNGSYDFITHFIVYCNDRKIGYGLHADCFYVKDMKDGDHDFSELYGEVTEANHTFEIGYLIGEEEYLAKGIGKRMIRLLEEKIIELGGKEIAADPLEENLISIKTLLSNGFKKKKDGDYRKTLD
ncbi:MAG: GNAT family N-acetyltransferase [Rikenellaceae bacterium]|jgi:RimJ/RimL family protein N-acetyltransferase|nr:GNAT family N-acetyltransferase [Rikenellaceae bacterium]